MKHEHFSCRTGDGDGDGLEGGAWDEMDSYRKLTDCIHNILGEMIKNHSTEEKYAFCSICNNRKSTATRPTTLHPWFFNNGRKAYARYEVDAAIGPR